MRQPGGGPTCARRCWPCRCRRKARRRRACPPPWLATPTCGPAPPCWPLRCWASVRRMGLQHRAACALCHRRQAACVTCMALSCHGSVPLPLLQALWQHPASLLCWDWWRAASAWLPRRSPPSSPSPSCSAQAGARQVPVQRCGRAWACKRVPVASCLYHGDAMMHLTAQACAHPHHGAAAGYLHGSSYAAVAWAALGPAGAVVTDLSLALNCFGEGPGTSESVLPSWLPFPAPRLMQLERFNCQGCR